MKIILTERQLKMLLEGEKNSEFAESLKTMYDYTNNLINRVLKVYKINLKMLLTWGTSVGGLVLPLDNFIRNGNFNITEDQKLLVLAGVIFAIFFKNKKKLSSLLDKINKEGLDEVFEVVVNKGSELKDSFKGFIENVTSTSLTFSEILAYSFLIPIITDIYEFSQGVTNFEDAGIRLTKRLLAAGVVLISSEILSDLMKKLLKKLK